MAITRLRGLSKVVFEPAPAYFKIPKAQHADLLAQLPLQKEFYKASRGKGGQKVNKSYSAAMITTEIGGEKIVVEEHKAYFASANMVTCEQKIIAKVEEMLNRDRIQVFADNTKQCQEELQDVRSDPSRHLKYRGLMLKIKD